MIDVVIVAKNEQKHLDSVLAALAGQENCSEQIQVFVVDNGSSDETVAIANKWAARVIQITGTLGMARNFGIRSGAAKYIGFLDGHSVPSPGWAAAYMNAFEINEDLGGCMGSIENICERPGTKLLAKESLFASPEKLWRSTISGLDSTLPWITTGNCMYSRKALEDAGLFTEHLFRCEDTDLSWKVVLKGYQLLYVPEARVTHFDHAGSTSYFRKYYNYGAGAAELAQRYGLQAKEESSKNLSGNKMLLDFCYKMGFKANSKLPNSFQQNIQVNESFRRPFHWRDDTTLALSRSAIFWFVDEQVAICIELTKRLRLELRDTSLFLFRLIEKGMDRVTTIKCLSTEYDISESQAAKDIDEFVQNLLNEKILLQSAP
jgi:GT2 family glycosyltransferase